MNEYEVFLNEAADYFQLEVNDALLDEMAKSYETKNLTKLQDK